MTSHEYLVQVLTNHDVSTYQVGLLQDVRTQIENKLRPEIGSYPRFYYAGSYGKKTMISDSFDLDIVVYYPSNSKNTIKETYCEVESALSRQGYRHFRKNVAIRLNFDGGFHVDIVPGKAQDNSFNYATLYKSEEDSTFQTSIKTHIDNARRCRDIIRLMKIWKTLWQNTCSSFTLELLVVYGLWKTPINSYGDSMMKVLQYIRDNILTVRLDDPANTNNILQVSSVERSQLQRTAVSSIAQPNWGQIIK